MDYNLLHTEFQGLVGFRQAFDPSYPLLHPDLLQSDSGLLVNSLEERFLSAEVIADCLGLFEGMSFDPYNVGTTYAKGAKVEGYVSLVDDNIGNAVTDTDFWETSLSYIVRRYVESGIKEALTEVFTENNVEKYNKKLLSVLPLFSENNKAELKAKEAGFVGFHIVPKISNSLKIEINKVGLRADTAGDYTFYFYHSSKTEPLKTVVITVEDTNFKWHDLNITIDGVEENTGGYYELGLKESEMPGNLYVQDFEEYFQCFSCSKYNLNFQLWDKYRSYYHTMPVRHELDVHPVVDEDNLTSLGYGPFNLKITTSCDPTYFILEAKDSFDLLIQHKTAIKILSDLMSTDRVNSVAENARSEIYQILHGRYITSGRTDKKVSGGLIDQYEMVKKQVKIDLENMDPACLGNHATLYDGSI